MDTINSDDRVHSPRTDPLSPQQNACEAMASGLESDRNDSLAASLPINLELQVVVTVHSSDTRVAAFVNVGTIFDWIRDTRNEYRDRYRPQRCNQKYAFKKVKPSDTTFRYEWRDSRIVKLYGIDSSPRMQPNQRGIGGTGFFSGMKELVSKIHSHFLPTQFLFRQTNLAQEFETGHILADSLGGSEFMPENYSAQTMFSNRGYHTG